MHRSLRAVGVDARWLTGSFRHRHLGTPRRIISALGTEGTEVEFPPVVLRRGCVSPAPSHPIPDVELGFGSADHGAGDGIRAVLSFPA